ncbi:hypothetical protein [Nonomuraea solani]|uniref:hypothetical protein n=1 Tax=Nonomuraea solani TaxID=1144553 RepID=UPI00190EA8D0|nr:hypothetical protein [Nonomuraea solani]
MNVRTSVALVGASKLKPSAAAALGLATTQVAAMSAPTAALGQALELHEMDPQCDRLLDRRRQPTRSVAAPARLETAGMPAVCRAAKLIDFETTLPSAVEELIQQWEERQPA